MKIAVFHELPYGGARRAMNQYANNLKARNDVDLYIVDEKTDRIEESFYSRVFFYRFVTRSWQGKNWKVRLYKDTIELIKLYYFHIKIAHEIDKKKYDIVFVSASKYIEAPFIMRSLKTPFVFYIHDPNYRLVYDPLLKVSKDLDSFRYYYENLNRFVRKMLDKKNISCCRLFLSPSKYIAKKFEKTYDRKNKVVYYGVDTAFFTPSDTKQDIDVFYTGSYHPIDGYDLLKEALHLMKIKPKVKILAFEEEWVSDDKELRELYRRSKIVVCPARKEGLGAVALEAMSCGIPVIAVNEAGHKETVTNNVTGYLIPRNPAVLAEKLTFLLTHLNEAKRLGINGRELMIKEWSWKKRSLELENLFMEYLGRMYE